MFVHVGGTGDSVFLAETDELENLRLVPNVNLCQVFDVWSEFVFADFQIAFTNVKKITNFLHVQFEDGYFEFVLN